MKYCCFGSYQFFRKYFQQLCKYFQELCKYFQELCKYFEQLCKNFRKVCKYFHDKIYVCKNDTIFSFYAVNLVPLATKYKNVLFFHT